MTTSTPEPVEVLVLGGGPGGASAAAILAKAGVRVRVLERDHFPRFHIGESLLPASVPLFDRLGIHDRVRACSVHKPGGKWWYGSRPVFGPFHRMEKGSSFEETPYSYMVERSRFDELLLRRAEELGAEVLEGHSIDRILEEDGRVVGAVATGPDGVVQEHRGGWVLDASGLAAVVATHLGLRKRTEPRRMAIYSRYKARPIDPELQEGWFVGQMIYDGWVWTIPLGQDDLSVGVVLAHEQYRRLGKNPEELLEYCLEQNDYFQTGIEGPLERLDEVRVCGAMGHTSPHLTGDGWTLIGDAGYFIDPCFSSGVHLALSSGMRSADLLLEARAAGAPPCPELFREYEADLKQHEVQVQRMVDAFYMASRSPLARRFIPLAQKVPRWHRKAVTFVGGDFTSNHRFVNLWYGASWAMEKLYASTPPPPGSSALVAD
jgi:flavin-dependent dehydrogenase